MACTLRSGGQLAEAVAPSERLIESKQMVIIRPEQLEAFQPAAEVAFERRVAEYLRENHAEEFVIIPSGEHQVQDLDDETLLRMVRAGVERARSYGMAGESAITAFIILMFTVAPNFDEHPLIRRTLIDVRDEPDQKIDKLLEQTTDENWEVSQEGYDARAWNLADEGVLAR